MLISCEWTMTYSLMIIFLTYCIIITLASWNYFRSGQTILSTTYLNVLLEYGPCTYIVHLKVKARSQEVMIILKLQIGHATHVFWFREHSGWHPNLRSQVNR